VEEKGSLEQKMSFSEERGKAEASSWSKKKKNTTRREEREKEKKIPRKLQN